jgi:hypothetical protein
MWDFCNSWDGFGIPAFPMGSHPMSDPDRPHRFRRGFRHGHGHGNRHGHTSRVATVTATVNPTLPMAFLGNFT